MKSLTAILVLSLLLTHAMMTLGATSSSSAKPASSSSSTTTTTTSSSSSAVSNTTTSSSSSTNNPSSSSSVVSGKQLGSDCTGDGSGVDSCRNTNPTWCCMYIQSSDGTQTHLCSIDPSQASSMTSTMASTSVSTSTVVTTSYCAGGIINYLATTILLVASTISFCF